MWVAPRDRSDNTGSLFSLGIPFRVRLELANGWCCWQPHKEDHELAAGFFEELPAWLQEGKIRPNNVKVFDGGLDDVPKGFQEHRDGKVSGYKIVYKLA